MKKLALLVVFVSTLTLAQSTSINLTGSTVSCNAGTVEVGETALCGSYLVTNNTGSTFTWLATPFVFQAYPFIWDVGHSYSANEVVIYTDSHWYESLIFSNLGNTPSTSPTDWQDRGTPPKVVTAAADGVARWRIWGEGCNPNSPSATSFSPATWSFPNGSQCGLNCYANPNASGAQTGHCYLVNGAGTITTTVNVSVTGTSIPLSGGATLPQAQIDATYHAPASCTTTVSTSGALTTALASLACGQTICLTAGSTISGNFTIPAIAGGACSTPAQITTSDWANLTSPGTRIQPSFASHMAKVQDTSGGTALTYATGVHDTRLVGIEVTSTSPGGFLIKGQSNTTAIPLSSMPYNNIIDRSYVHSEGTTGGYGIELDGSFAVVDSYIAGEGTDETQGINTCTSNGPILIRNNYIQAVGENLMFGGCDSGVLGAVPQDATITGNYLYKPLTWDPWCTNPATAGCESTTYDGISRTVKNLFEFKKCVRCLVQGNVFTHSWLSAQDTDILFEPTDQNGSDLFAQDRDITFQYNYIHGAFMGLNHNSCSYAFPSNCSKHWTIQNNVWDHVGDPGFGTGIPYAINNWSATNSGGGHFRWSSNPTADADVWIQHNDFLGDYIGGFFNIQASTIQINGFNLKNNIASHGTYGLIINGTTGTANVSTIWSTVDLAKNVMIGTNPGTYDSNFVFAANNAAVGFTNYAAGNYLLTSGSPYHNAATDGKDYGADILTLNQMTSCSVSGCNPSGGGTTVTVSPTTANLPTLGIQQFTASPTGAAWSLNAGCSSSITSAGFLTGTSTPETCTVTATIGSSVGLATANIIQFAVSPVSVTIQVGAKQQFVANFAATFAVTSGSCTTTTAGLLTAPGSTGSCVLRATATNGGATATAAISVVPAPDTTPGGKVKGGKGQWKKFN